MPAATLKRTDTADAALAAVVRRLRARVESELRYRELIGLCSRANDAVSAGKIAEASSLIVELEEGIDACDALSHELSQWYCVRTMVQREAGAQKELQERGHATFCPMEIYIKQTSRNRDEASRPLFPGYVFVLSRESDFAEILKLDRVQQFVRYQRSDGASRPMPFPLAAILGMQAEEREGHYRRARKAKVSYRPRKGDKVRVNGGTWMLYTARVLAAPGAKRAKVMLDGPRGRKMEVDIALLSPA